MFRYDDRIKVASVSVGLGDFVLGAASGGARDFTGLVIGDQFGYTIEDANQTQWEVGVGTYSAANTLTRTRVLSSTNAGAKVNFAAGAKVVYLTLVSESLQNSATRVLNFPNVGTGSSGVMSRTGWVLTASAQGGGATSQAVDNNTGSRWATGGPVVPNTSYFQIDTGVSQPVQGVQLDQTGVTGDIPTAGKVQGSNDGVGWTDLAVWSLANLAGNIFTVTWASANWRFIKLLATATPTVSSNWWSIAEAYLLNGPPAGAPVEVVAPETIKGQAGYTLTVKYMVRKLISAADTELRIGADANNHYSCRFQPGNIKLTRTLAGAGNDLANQVFANDSVPRMIEFVIAIPYLAGDANWIFARWSDPNGSPRVISTFDSVLDFTAGIKTFRLFIADTGIARGWGYRYGPSLG